MTRKKQELFLWLGPIVLAWSFVILAGIGADRDAAAVRVQHEQSSPVVDMAAVEMSSEEVAKLIRAVHAELDAPPSTPEVVAELHEAREEMQPLKIVPVAHAIVTHAQPKQHHHHHRHRHRHHDHRRGN